MAFTLFGVPTAVHEAVVKDTLASQRLIIADLIAKVETLAVENDQLKATVNQAFADLNELRRRPTTPPELEPRKGPMPLARRPAFAQSSIAGGQARKRPEPEEAA
jgi:hypothetical protein